MRSPVSVALAALALAAIVGAPTGLAVGGSLVGDGWIYLVVDPLPYKTRMSITTFAEAPLAIGVVLFNENAGRVSVMLEGSRPTEVGTSTFGVPASVHALGGRTVELNESFEASATPSHVLFWASGEVGAWSYHLHIPETTAVREIERGESAIYWDGAQPGEGFHAHVTIDGTGAAISNITYDVTFQKRFFGSVGTSHQWIPLVGPPPPGTIEDEVTLTRQGGEPEPCVCFGSIAQPLLGNAQIRWAGPQVHGKGVQAVMLAGVDVDFPREDV